MVDALSDLKVKEIKPIETKPIDYDHYYIDRMVGIRNQFNKIEFNDLTLFYKGSTAPMKFIGFRGPLHIFKSIYSGSIPLEDVEKEKIKFKSNLNHVRQGNP